MRTTGPPRTVTISAESVEVVADEMRPGVLVRGIGVAGDRGHCTIERAYAGEAWVPVRSGFPARISNGEAVAYDLEVEPGRRALYRVAGARPVAVVDVPRLRPCEAWLIHVERPSLSMRVSIKHPDEATRAGRSTFVEVDGAGVLPQVISQGLGGESGSLTVWVGGREATRATTALLTTPGTLLLQAREDHGLEPLYLAVTGMVRSRPGAMAGWDLRAIDFAWRQVDRPWPGEAPLRIPGWSWRVATDRASSLTLMAQRHPTRWDLLLAGIRASSTV